MLRIWNGTVESDILEKTILRANLIRVSRGKVFLSILTSQWCRCHLKLRSSFIMLNIASVRNISIMGKTYKSPCTINAKGNRRSLSDQEGSLKDRAEVVRCCWQVFAKLFTCRKTTESRFVVLEKFLIKISVIVNHVTIYVLSTARHYKANSRKSFCQISYAKNISP